MAAPRRTTWGRGWAPVLRGLCRGRCAARRRPWQAAGATSAVVGTLVCIWRCTVHRTCTAPWTSGWWAVSHSGMRLPGSRRSDRDSRSCPCIHPSSATVVTVALGSRRTAPPPCCQCHTGRAAVPLQPQTSAMGTMGVEVACGGADGTHGDT